MILILSWVSSNLRWIQVSVHGVHLQWTCLVWASSGWYGCDCLNSYFLDLRQQGCITHHSHPCVSWAYETCRIGPPSGAGSWCFKFRSACGPFHKDTFLRAADASLFQAGSFEYTSLGSSTGVLWSRAPDVVVCFMFGVLIWWFYLNLCAGEEEGNFVIVVHNRNSLKSKRYL